MVKKDVKSRLIRWVLLLLEFDFEVKDRKGVETQEPTTCLDWRMKLCVNWEKMPKLIIILKLTCIRRFSTYHLMV